MIHIRLIVYLRYNDDIHRRYGFTFKSGLFYYRKQLMQPTLQILKRKCDTILSLMLIVVI